MLYPLTFHPIFKERVWGGRQLEALYGKKLPPGASIGESWEISDRPGDVSVIANGPLAGKDLRWLMEHHERDLLGNSPAPNGRFPLLVKLLDARETLSLQVHPSPAKSAESGGEPKTEMWYITHAAPGAELLAGLKCGVTRDEFETRLRAGTVADCVHRLPVKAGDSLFLPSGRLHALGAGIVLVEIQENSDTTYRVFDWNRAGLDGKPRQLHTAQSLASIDFNDVEPALTDAPWMDAGNFKVRFLARDPLFKVDLFHPPSASAILFRPTRLRIFAAVSGRLQVTDGDISVELQPGQFCLAPANIKTGEVRPEPDSRFLVAELAEPSNRVILVPQDRKA